MVIAKARKATLGAAPQNQKKIPWDSGTWDNGPNKYKAFMKITSQKPRRKRRHKMSEPRAIATGFLTVNGLADPSSSPAVHL